MLGWWLKRTVPAISRTEGAAGGASLPVELWADGAA